MGYVRPFNEADIPKVADLHRRVFLAGYSSSSQLNQSYRSYFSRVFLNHPWCDSKIPSLVYEETNGDIIGFLGVQPRRMSMNGRPVQAAVSSQFIVDPACRSTLAGLQLLKVFFSGPQDLSISDEANDVSRKLWEGHNGTTALLYSLYWFRLLQPTQFLLSRFSPGAFHPMRTYFWGPLCRFADALSGRMSPIPLRWPEPGVLGEDIEHDTLLSCLSEFSRSYSLRPEYDDRSLDWILDKLSGNRAPGTLHKIAVRSANRKLIGWYLYHLTPGGLGEVLQMGAKPDTVKSVLDHLFHHAWRQGATAVSGRIEPRFIPQFREKHCHFHHRGYWIILHSRRPELLQAVLSGDAFLTRLEGEWCMRFHLNGQGRPEYASRLQKILRAQFQ